MGVFERAILVTLLFLVLTMIAQAIKVNPINSYMVAEVTQLDPLFNGTLENGNNTHYIYKIDYKNFSTTIKDNQDIGSTQTINKNDLTSMYPEGIPVYKEGSVPTTCTKIDSKTQECQEETKNYTALSTRYAVIDNTWIPVPKQTGQWHIGNQSTIITITNHTIGLFNYTYFNGTAVILNLSISPLLNGSYTGAVINLTAHPQREGDTINVTVNANTPAQTKINTSIRYHNISNDLLDGLVAWWDFNTFNDTQYSVQELTRNWQYQENIDTRFKPSNSSLTSMGYYETGLTMVNQPSSGQSTAPHGLYMSAGEINKFVTKNIEFTTCAMNNLTWPEGGSKRGIGGLYIFNTIWMVATLDVNAEHFKLRGVAINNSETEILTGITNNYFDWNKWIFVCHIKNLTHHYLCVYSENAPSGDCTSASSITGNMYNKTAIYSGICTSGVQFTGFNGTCDNVMIWNASKSNQTLIKMWQHLYEWSNYQNPCDKSVNTSGCIYNRESNFTQVKFELITENTSLTPVLYNYSITLQNATEGEPPIVDYPDQVTALINLTTTNTSINISWKANTGQLDGGFKVYLNGTLNQTISNYLQNSTNITDLLCGTTYNVTVNAYNATGENTTGSTANQQNYRTLNCPETPILSLPNIPTITIVNISNTSINISWVKAANHNNGGYLIYQNGTLKANHTELGFNTYNFTSLTISTQYNLTILPYNDSGINNTVIDNTNQKLVTTNGNVEPVYSAPPTIINLTATNYTNTTVNLTWIKHAAQNNGGYLVYRNGTLVKNETNYLSYTFNDTGLTINTQYNYTVFSYNTTMVNTTVNISTSILVTTNGNIAPVINYPDAVTNLINLTTTNTSINVSWKIAADHSNGWVGVYLNGTLYQNITTLSWNTSNITSLNCSSTYNITVFSGNNTGVNLTVGAGNSQNYKTLDCPVPPGEYIYSFPDQVTNLLNVSTTNVSVNVTWKKAADQGNGGFLVYVNGSLFENITDIGKNSSLVTGLNVNTTYNFTVFAYNQTGTNTTIGSGNSQNYVTLANTPPIIPLQNMNLTNTSISYNSITISWNIANINTTKTIVYVNDTNTQNVTAPTNTTTIGGLTASSTYKIQVNSWNLGGENTTIQTNQINISTLSSPTIVSGKRILVGYYNSFKTVNMNQMTFACIPIIQNGVITGCI